MSSVSQLLGHDPKVGRSAVFIGSRLRGQFPFFSFLKKRDFKLYFIIEEILGIYFEGHIKSGLLFLFL